MTNVSRYVTAVLLVSMVAHACVAAASTGDAVERSVDDIGQPAAELIDDDAAVAQLAEAVADDLPVEPVALLVGYSRYHESDPLENATRESLYDRVTSTPGRSVTSLARDVDVPVSTARYHIRVLEDEELIDRQRIDGRARLYPDGYAGDPELIGALAASAPTAVVAAVRSEQPVSMTALAASAGLAPSTASYHVSRLTDSGVFERERDGRTVRVSLSADAMRLLGDGSGNGAP